MSKKSLYSLMLILYALGCFWLLLHLLFLEGQHHVTLCPFKAISGFPCPACGTTTSCVHILQGRAKEAIYANPLGYVAITFMIALPVWMLMDLIRKSDSLFSCYLRSESLIKRSLAVKILLFILILSIWTWNILKHINSV